ncbi:hypothetical protein V5O48_015021 [Marasmius crinis-equi]|uniref:EthD domain-containing protein n=1 Tax=Marasmius crinis-equi TaxID=585013 RepID=A0ABR3EVP7_9AGAR
MSFSIRNDRVKIIKLAKRRDDVSQEHFDYYRLNEHSKKELAYMKSKKEPLVYEQLHINQDEKEKLKKAEVAILECDGVVLFEAESFQSFGSIITDEFFNTIVPDEASFANREHSLVAPLKFASIVQHKEEKTDLPDTQVRKNCARMIYLFEKKEGLTDEEFTKAWLEGHARAVLSTPLGKKLLKSSADPNASIHAPKWNGIEIIDAPSFEDFDDPETAKILAEDGAKWQAPGSLNLLPVNIARIIDRDLHGRQYRLVRLYATVDSP